MKDTKDTKMNSNSVAAAATAVAEAHALWKTAKEQSSIARNVETDALNKLNEAQKRFDAAVAAWKEANAGEGDWSAWRQRHVAAPVPLAS